MSAAAAGSAADSEPGPLQPTLPPAPLPATGLFGEKIQKALPHCCSLSDYVGYRFGPVLKIVVALLCLFNMSIAMLAEYTTIGALFKDFVGSINYPIIIVVAVLTLAYTAYGGLAVSIITDQLQGAFAIMLTALLTIYVAATFRPEGGLPSDFGANRALLVPNEAGYSAIFVMPCSLMAATVFSEAIWQRVWASQDKKALRFGASVGCAGIVAVVFLIGFSGVLATWANKIPTNYNLYLFQVGAG
jgi:Na+/proline symporter